MSAYGSAHPWNLRCLCVNKWHGLILDLKFNHKKTTCHSISFIDLPKPTMKFLVASSPTIIPKATTSWSKRSIWFHWPRSAEWEMKCLEGKPLKTGTSWDVDPTTQTQYGYINPTCLPKSRGPEINSFPTIGPQSKNLRTIPNMLNCWTSRILKDSLDFLIFPDVLLHLRMFTHLGWRDVFAKRSSPIGLQQMTQQNKGDAHCVQWPMYKLDKKNRWNISNLQSTLPKTSIAPKSRPSQKESTLQHLPTFNFRVPCWFQGR